MVLHRPSPESVEPLDGVQLIEGNADAGVRNSGRPHHGVLRPVAGLIVAVLVAGLAISTMLRANPPDVPPSPPPAIFDKSRIDIFDSPLSAETRFPALGRPWGQTLLFPQRAGIVAVDLDTGESRVWLGADQGISPGGWSSATILSGVPYVAFGFGGVARVADGVATVVVDAGDPGAVTLLRGEFAVSTEPSQIEPRVEHLPTGALTDVASADAFAILGSGVFIERDGVIYLDEVNEQEREWVEGSFLGSGMNAVVWRSCDADGSCEVWAGDAEAPRTLRLKPEVAAAVLVSPDPEAVSGELIPETLSPDGRFTGGWGPAEHRGANRLVDLVSGSDVDLGTSLVQAWTADGGTFATLVAPTVTVVDMETGTAARIPLHVGAGARRSGGVRFVMTDELPWSVD